MRHGLSLSTLCTRAVPQTADLSLLLSANGHGDLSQAQKSNFPSFGLLTYTVAVVVAAAELRLNSFTAEARVRPEFPSRNTKPKGDAGKCKRGTPNEALFQ